VVGADSGALVESRVGPSARARCAVESFAPCRVRLAPVPAELDLHGPVAASQARVLLVAAVCVVLSRVESGSLRGAPHRVAQSLGS
jgi:hypothetical protein